MQLFADSGASGSSVVGTDARIDHDCSKFACSTCRKGAVPRTAWSRGGDPSLLGAPAAGRLFFA